MRSRDNANSDDVVLTLDLSNNLVDVVLVVSGSVISDGELSVGSLGVAVTVRKIVDDCSDKDRSMKGGPTRL